MYSTKKTVTFRKSKGVDLADQGMCGLVQPLLKKLGLDLVFQSVRPVNNLQYISKLVKKAVFQWKGTSTWSSMKSILICHRPIVNIAVLKRPCSKLWTTSSWKWTCSIWPWWSCWIEAPHLTQLIIIRLRRDVGIRGKVLDWCSSYLSNWSQQVSIDGSPSRQFPLDCGVPWGSCLGPLLFVIYTSLLFKVIEHHLPHVHCIKDDNAPDETLRAMGECIHDL